MTPLLVACALVMSMSLAGVLFAGWRASAFISRHLDMLVSFSAGVFLVFAYGLATETVEHSSSLPQGLGWILGGAVGIWLLVKFMPGLHTHSHGHDHGQAPHLDPRRLIVSDAIHNMGDGIFLAASFAVGPVLATSAVVSIMVHEFLQEMAEFFVMRDAGYSVRKALTVNFGVSSAILVGAIGGYFLLDIFEVLEAPLLGIAAGGILVVVLHDLIPHSIRDAHSGAHYAKHVAAFVVGAVLMVGLDMLLPHEEAAHTSAHQGPVASTLNAGYSGGNAG